MTGLCGKVGPFRLVYSSLVSFQLQECRRKSHRPTPGSAMSWGGAEPEAEPGQPPMQPGSDAGAGKSGLVFEQD